MAVSKKEISEFFAAEGLDVGEELAVAAIRATFRMLRLLGEKLAPPLNLLIPSMVNLVEPYILELADKIDGEDDQGY